MSGFLGAVSLLTRWPIRAGGAQLERSGSKGSAPWFPVVGSLVGLVVAVTYAALLEILPALVAAGLAVSVGILLTGALHEDGLADTADALGGSHDRARAREILKDPRVGTFGALAIALSVLLRVGAIGALDAPSAFAIVVAAHSLGRAAALGLMGALPVAAEGLGASYADPVSRRGLVSGLLVGVAVAALGTGLWVLPALGLTLLGAAAVGRLSAARLGGFAGDVLGACEQVVETTVLLLGAAIAHNDWPSAAWWS